jgi:hypothetical protein
MKSILISGLATAVLYGFVAGAPAFAQDTVTGAPANQAPVTVQGYHGYGSPAYGPAWGSRYGYGPIHRSRAHAAYGRCRSYHEINGRRLCGP